MTADVENDRIWQRKVVANQTEIIVALHRIEELLLAILRAKT